MIENRRREPRIVIQVLGEYQSPLGALEWSRGLFIDSSAGGGRMLTSVSLGVLTPLAIRLQIGQEFLSGMAVVAWSRPLRQGRVWAAGFTFDHQAPEELNRFLDRGAALLQ